MIRLIAVMLISGVLLNSAGEAITGRHAPPYGAGK